MAEPNAKQVQARLRDLGYYHGKIDGAFGKVSAAAALAALADVQPLAIEPMPDGELQVTSPDGRAAITQREGNKLTAYRDSVGIWTIGVGHTAAAGEPIPRAGMKITAAESDAILARDLHDVEAAIRNAVKVPLAQHEFDALASLTINIGAGAFAKSTLVKKLNAGDRAGAANAFLSWNKARGKVLKGLTARRTAERLQFLGA
jgi:GH24 family phage-related lysozyme (muramidase)